MQFILDDGTKCDLIYKFNNNGIDYIIYTDGTKDEIGNLRIYASRYVMNNDKYVLKDILYDYEWNLIDQKIGQLGE